MKPLAMGRETRQRIARMLETVRTILIWTGFLVFLGGYAVLLVSAFKRDALWGIFSIFCAPLGGWLHGATDWLFQSRNFIISVGGFVFMAVVVFWFPRQKIYGHWTDQSGNVILRFDPDGRLRNFDLEPDGKFHFRGYRILTAELKVKSNTRIKLEGLPGFHVGYLRPREDVIDLFHELKDPELGLALDIPANRFRLVRVPEPLAADFQNSLTWFEQREHLQAAALKLIPPSTPKVKPNAPPSPAMLERYRQRMTAARTLARAQLEKLPVLEQIEVLRFRIVHGPAIGTGATAEALIAQDVSDDYFKLSALRGFTVNEVNVGKDLLRGVVGMSKSLGFGENEYVSMVASRTTGGNWGFELDHRGAGLAKQRLQVSGLEPALERAQSYLRSELGLTVTPAELQPLP